MAAIDLKRFLPYFPAMKSYGADVSVHDYDRRTPLHVAASEGNLKMVKYLMEVRSLWNCKNNIMTKGPVL